MDTIPSYYQSPQRQELFATVRQVLGMASQLLIGKVGESSLLDYFDIRQSLFADWQDDPTGAFHMPLEGFMARGSAEALLELLLQDADRIDTMGDKEKARVAAAVSVLGGEVLRNWDEVCVAADVMEAIITDTYGYNEGYFLYSVGSEKVTLFSDPDFGQIAETVVITPRAATSYAGYRIEGSADTIPNQYLSRARGSFEEENSFIYRVNSRLQKVSGYLGHLMRSSPGIAPC